MLLHCKRACSSALVQTAIEVVACSCFEQTLYTKLINKISYFSACRCLNLSTSIGGTRSKVEGEDRHDLEPEGTREDTRHKIYTGSGSQSSYPTSCLQYCALRLVLFPGGIVDVRLGTRPSFI
jgi:hypothetical protein